MNSKKGILSVKDYGKIVIILKREMDARNINRNQLARAVNTRFEVIDKWYNGDVEKIDTDILARICYVLGCGVSEIMEYRAAEHEESTILSNQ